MRLLRRIERSYIFITDNVLLGHAACVLILLLLRYLGGDGTIHRRHDIQANRLDRVARLLVQSDRYLGVFPERHLAETKIAVLASPYQHIALPGGQGAFTLRVRILAGYRVELRVIVNLELYVSALDGFPLLVVHRDNGFGGRSVVVDDVDFRMGACPLHDLLRSVVFAEYFRVHQHAAIGGSVEPSQVEYGLRLASAEEIPFTVHPGLYPRVVIVSMRPTRRVHLARRNANRTKRGDGEGRLLTTTSIGGLHRSQRRTGTCVRRCVDDLLVAPVVHFQHGVVQGEVLDALFQLGVEYRTALVQVLVIYPHGQYEVAEDFLRDAVAPRHLLARLERGADVSQIKVTAIIRDIPNRHIRVHKSQRLPFRGSHLLVKHSEKIPIRQSGLLGLEIILYLSSIRSIRDEMLLIIASCPCDKQSEQPQK